MGSVVHAHPVSYTDAWARVSDVVDVRLNVFLDDVVRNQLKLPADQTFIEADSVTQAIRDYSENLGSQLRIYSDNGQLLPLTVLSVPTYQPRTDMVDLLADSSLKLSWKLRFSADKQVSTISSLCVVHHFTDPQLPQPGELRLHLLHVESGSRMDAVIPPERPHTMVMPDPERGSVGPAAPVNSAVSRITISPLGVIHEFSAPLLLFDSAWPAAKGFRESLRQPAGNSEDADDKAWLDSQRQEVIRTQVLEWAQSAIELQFGGTVCRCDSVHIELMRAGESAAETTAGQSARLPVFGAYVGIRMLYHPANIPASGKVCFQETPGPFQEMLTELVTAKGQNSRLVPIPTDSDGGPGFAYSFSSESGAAGIQDPETRSDRVLEPAAVIDPIYSKLSRPGRRGFGVGLFMTLILGGSAFSRRCQSLPVIRRILIVCAACAPAVCVWAMPERTRMVDQEQAQKLTMGLLDRVYHAALMNDERRVVAELSEVLQADLAEEVFLATARSLKASAADGILMDISTVSIDRIQASNVDGSDDRIKAETKWRVGGTVYHWGHVHQRELILNGLVTLAKEGNMWKVRGISLSEPPQFEAVTTPSTGS